jgi:hypothetical protein
MFIGIYRDRDKTWQPWTGTGFVGVIGTGVAGDRGIMSRIASRLAELRLDLPPPMRAPGGIELPFPWINVRGERVITSGHGPQNTDGSLAEPFGKVGTEVTLDQGREPARKVGLSILGSLQRELGDLDRIAGWVRVFDMVNSAPAFDRHPAVINGFLRSHPRRVRTGDRSPRPLGGRRRRAALQHRGRDRRRASAQEIEKAATSREYIRRAIGAALTPRSARDHR